MIATTKMKASELMAAHKINLQMGKRVNIVASCRTHTYGNVIMDTPLGHTHIHIEQEIQASAYTIAISTAKHTH